MFDFFNQLFSVLMNFLLSIYTNIMSFLRDTFGKLFDLLSDLFGSFFSALVDFLNAVFTPIWKLLDGIFYLFQQLASVVYWVLLNIKALFSIVYSLVVGFFNTIKSFFAYDPQMAAEPSLGVYNDGFNLVINKLNMAGFQTVALIILAVVWLMMVGVFLKVVARK